MARVDPTPHNPAAAPTVPDRTNRTSFASQMFAFFTWLAGALYNGVINLAADTYANALDAFSSAGAAATSATASANSASAAQSASATAGAIAWVSGTTYSIGDARYSPITLQTYRRKTNGAGTTDPSADATNWTIASNLPPVAGNSGKFLQTPDGISVAWAYPGIGSVAATVTAATTLAAPAFQYVPVAMATMGKAITLPAANTLPVGGPLYLFDNIGGYAFGVRDNAGGLITGIAPGGDVLLSLKDNSTAAGVWTATGTSLEPGLITVDSTFSSTFTSTPLYPQFVALDANTSIHFAQIASGFAAFVMDNAGKVVTTPVTVTAVGSSKPAAVFKISATQAIVFYGSSTSVNNAVVLTLSGASPTFTLSVGTPAAFAPTLVNANWSGENGQGNPYIAQLAPALYMFVATLSGSANVSATAISVSGAVVTIGTAVNFGSTVGSQPTVYALTATTACCFYKTGASPVATAVVLSVAGTTVTVNTPVAIVGPGVSGNGSPSIAISATKLIYAEAALAYAITISGTTVTVGAGVTIPTTAGTFDSRWTPYLWLISAGATNVIGYWVGSGVTILSETSGTIVAGTTAAGVLGVAFGWSDTNGFMLPQGTTEFCSMHLSGASNAWKARIAPAKITGTTITAGAGCWVDINPTITAINTTRLASGDYILTPTAGISGGAPSLPVFRSNGDTVNLRGAITCPAIDGGSGGFIGIPYSFPIAAAPNRLVLLGGTSLVSAQGGLRLLNVEIAQ